MFKKINHINDVRDAVENVKEIRFTKQPNGITIGCYMFMDSKTFNTQESLECRGIAFNDAGAIVSRPLHKFFNLGEKEWLTAESLIGKEKTGEIAAIFEKVDGSMIASASLNGELVWRSKKAFNSDVVNLANAYLAESENSRICDFANEALAMGLTVIFEITHPLARIVVAQDSPNFQLLHVRDNLTGDYVMLDKCHAIHALIEKYQVPVVRRYYDLAMSEVFQSLESMEGQEGYVVQFKNGDMVKLKCDWYNRLHGVVTFLRERDIATLSLNEQLDDTKILLVEAGIDLTSVNEVESRLKNILTGLMCDIEQKHEGSKHLDRKEFAIKHKGDPLFGLIMARYQGREVTLTDWYAKNNLKNDFSLKVLADGAFCDDLSD